MLAEIKLDARELAPPEPFARATEILRQLQPGQYLRMLHRRAPYPLFEFCLEMDLSYSVIESTVAPCEIVVYCSADEQALQTEGVL